MEDKLNIFKRLYSSIIRKINRLVGRFEIQEIQIECLNDELKSVGVNSCDQGVHPFGDVTMKSVICEREIEFKETSNSEQLQVLRSNMPTIKTAHDRLNEAVNEQLLLLERLTSQRNKHIVILSDIQISPPDNDDLGQDSDQLLNGTESDQEINSIKIGWDDKVPWQLGIGFANFGSTCYMNAVFMALFHISTVVQWLINQANNTDSGVKLVQLLQITRRFAKHHKVNAVVKPLITFIRDKPFDYRDDKLSLETLLDTNFAGEIIGDPKNRHLCYSAPYDHNSFVTTSTTD